MSSEPTQLGLVFGGVSGEHAVSIRSANTVAAALRSGANASRYSLRCFYIDQWGHWWPPAVAEAVLAKGTPARREELPAAPLRPGFQGFPAGALDVEVWVPVLHGPNGEDGTVQGLFTLMGKPFVGAGVLGSAVAMDKLAMKAAFAAAGLAQVPYVGLNAADLQEPERRDAVVARIEQDLGYPCFVKPANLGSSVGITKARDCSQLLSGLDEAASLDSRIVVEQGVNARELECAVLGKRQLKASVVGEIRFDADWYDYTTKYSDGLSTTLIPAPIPESLQDQVRTMALASCRALCVEGMARVDFFYDDRSGDLWINEINTLPGFTSLSMYPMLWNASGIGLEQLVAQLVESARE